LRRVTDSRTRLDATPRNTGKAITSEFAPTRGHPREQRHPLCQQFYFFPAGGDVSPSRESDNRRSSLRSEISNLKSQISNRHSQIDTRQSAVAGIGKFQRAREEPPPVPVHLIHVASRVEPTGYTMEARIPAECLVGFDPQEHSRMGFYYILEDADHGQQYLTVGDNLLWYADPSTWAIATLK
jgi:hypothetical protein